MADPEGNGFKESDRKKAENHRCSQEVTLNTMCIKLENIEKSIAKIEEFQRTYAEQIEAIRLTFAKYPSSDVVGITMDKVKLHETYFALGGTALFAAWGFILWLVNKLWSGS